MSVTLTTTHGTLKFELFCTACPKTCYNFLALCASGYYNDVPIHRIIPNFIFQSGDGELKTGKGGKSIWGEGFEEEISPALRHDRRGVLAMANKGVGKRSNASQWYVTFAEQKTLDGNATVFGKVLEGWETIEKIEKVPIDKKGRPKEEVKIVGVRIHANPIADEEEDRD